MGRVFRARHVPTGAPRAVKLLSGSHDPESVLRFRREAEALARVGGVGIVPVHEAGLERGQLYFVMGLVTGGSLRSRLRREGKLPWREAASLAARIAAALARCHAAGIVHRDVKPDNVLLDEAGEPWLADFGCIRALWATRLTETGTSFGTLAYMAPEQLLGEEVDGRSDVFAVASVLHELVSGTAPYEARTVPEHLLARRTRARTRLTLHGAPEALDAILDRALAFAPEDRTPAAAALAFELEGLLAGKAPRRKPRPGRRRLAAVGLGVLGVAALVLLVGRGDPGAAADLARARAELVEGRRALASAESDTAPLTSAGDLSVASARDSAARAREHAEHALRAGLDGAAAAKEAALALEDDASRLAAARAVACGAPAEALAALERARPLERSHARWLETTLVRCRALFALGRLDEAERTLAAAATSSGEATLELLGDVRLARSDVAGARGAYDRAVALGGGEARLKRGRLAALAGGEDATALADFAAAVPNLGVLPEERARNARFAAFAPALYRSAIAQEDPEARQRVLEAAWRLAAPPAELASSVAKAWIGLLPAKVTAFFSSTREPTPRDKALLRRAVKFFHRAVEADPLADLGPLWDLASVLRVSYSPVVDAHALVIAREFFADWSDHPTIFLLEASALRYDRPEQCLALAVQGLEHLPPPRPGEDVEVSELARALENLSLDLVPQLDDRYLAVLTRAARRIGNVKCWIRIAAVQQSRGRLPEALAALDQGSLAENPLSEEARWSLADARFAILRAEGRGEEALAVAREHDDDAHDAISREHLAEALAERGLWDEILEKFPFAGEGIEKRATRNTLVVIVRALCARGRVVEARALATRVNAVHSSFLRNMQPILDGASK
jgi:hypothetical protein